MKLFSSLIGKSKASKAKAAKPAPVKSLEEARTESLVLDDAFRTDIARTDAPKAASPAAAPTAAAPVNIWDLEEGSEESKAPSAQNAAASRARRNRTRLIGFDTSEGDVVDLFDGAEKVIGGERALFPVGWLLVVSGPGRGHCFSLYAGMAQIGRSDENAVQLDFGDSAISRNNHAAVVFDADERKFLLGHGGKANLVRLNGKPVISNEDLVEGDTITIGETTMQLKVLCGDDFDWSDTEETFDDEEHTDVAIA